MAAAAGSLPGLAVAARLNDFIAVQPDIQAAAFIVGAVFQLHFVQGRHKLVENRHNDFSRYFVHDPLHLCRAVARGVRFANVAFAAQIGG